MANPVYITGKETDMCLHVDLASFSINQNGVISRYDMTFAGRKIDHTLKHLHLHVAV